MGYGESDGTFSITRVPFWYVDAASPEGGSGTMYSPFKTINSAESAGVAVYGDEIRVRQGVYSLTAPGTGTITLTDGVYLRGGYDDGWSQTGVSTIDGGGSIQCVYGTALTSAATIEYFTIMKGYSAGDGGGIYLYNSSPTISHCDFIADTAEAGGGIYDSSSAGAIIPHILYCNFTSNSAGYGAGAGIYNENNCNAKISNCNFTSNSGGGIANETSFPTISNCIFTSNISPSNGGAIINSDDSNSGISNCIFVSNEANAGYGGAIWNYYASPGIFNCAFVSNSSAYGGSAIASSNGGAAIRASTFTRNNALYGFGGVIYDITGASTIINSIIYGNSAGGITNGSPYITITYSCVQGGFGGDGNIDADPLFFRPDLGDVHLYNNSPCVNKGSASAASLGLDYTRFYGTNPDGIHGDDGLVDMGYHYSGYSVSANLLTDTTPPTVQVISPEGGEILTGNSIYYITWEASDDVGIVTPEVISFSTDGGASYNVIGTCDAGLTSYAWTVPNITTTQGKIKVSVADTSYNLGYGESDGLFSISRVAGYWYVDAASPEGGSGTMYSPFKTINSAESVGVAVYGDEIHVRRGTYNLYQGGPGPGTITLNDGIYLRGGYDDGWTQINNPSLTIISGEGQVQCMHGYELGSAATIENFTIRNGYSNGSISGYYNGGGIYLDTSSPTISNCDFVSNTADMYYGGGGIYLTYSAPEITNCNFIANTIVSGYGAGIYSDYGSYSILSNCGFTSNSADYGGAGIYSDGSTLEISNCAFNSNAASDGNDDGGGGAIYSDSYSTMGIFNSSFESNSAEWGGGGIYSDYSMLEIANCSFNSNSASYGGGDGYGGGIYDDSSSTLTVSNCTFKSNSAYLSGGGIYTAPTATLEITDSTFTLNNSLYGDGGCIYNDDSSNPTISRCMFASNTVEVGAGIVNYSAFSTISHCTFESNNGGCIINLGGSYFISTISNCDFTLNKYSGRGGCICNNFYDYTSMAIIEDCTFTSNEASGGGGGIYSDYGFSTISNCFFTLNSTPLHGGGIYNGYYSFSTISNCAFALNSASSSGGGIFNINSTTTIENCTFTLNSAPDNKGGGIYNDTTSPTIFNSIIYGNTGGSIFDNGGSSTVNNSCVQDGWSGSGADNISTDPLFATGPYGDLYLLPTSDCVDAGLGSAFSHRLAWQQGYGTNPNGQNGDSGKVDMGYHYSGFWQKTDSSTHIWYVDAASPEGNSGMTPESPFMDINSAEAAASFDDEIHVKHGTYNLYQDGNGPLTIILYDGIQLKGGYDDGWEQTLGPSSTIISGEGNVECMSGYLLSFAAVIDDFTIKNGYSAGDYGGGIYLDDSSPAISNCIFDSNNSDYGGGAVYNYSDNGSSPTFLNCSFISNSVNSGYGGGIYDETAYLTLSNCTFESNSAYNGGGGIYNDVSTQEITNCLFISNSANNGDYGGGIYNDENTNSIISGCSFTLNTAEAGGGIYEGYYTFSSISGCAFVSNGAESSSGDGGGLYDGYFSTLTLESCAFTSNSAFGGGGLYSYYDFLNLSNCTFTSNEANGYFGGGMYDDVYSTATIFNCAFTSNLANAATGGGMYISTYNSYPTIANSTFTLNSANSGYGGGGGIYTSSSYPTIINSIISGNIGGNILDSGGSSTVTYSCVPDGYVGMTGNITADPKLIAPSAGDVHIASNSPCVNAGSATAASLGLDYLHHYGTNPNLAYGDSGQLNMGYHYYGYTGSEDAITDITAPTVVVISPEGGEVLTGGFSYDITWEAADNIGGSGLTVNPISISYSLDGGASYPYSIATGIDNSGRYTWTVPNISTTEAMIKVTALDNSGNSGDGESAGVFSISRVMGIWHVDWASPEAGADGSAEHPFKTINAAESNMNMIYGDEIHVKKGTYNLYSGDGGPGTGPQMIYLTDGISLKGGYDDGWNQVNDPTITIISGEGNVPCMYGSGLTSAAIIDNFTIEDGYAYGNYGGGLYLDAASPTISHCDFNSNRSDYAGGGGIFIYDYSAPENLKL